jgi:hypothetical protein
MAALKGLLRAFEIRLSIETVVLGKVCFMGVQQTPIVQKHDNFLFILIDHFVHNVPSSRRTTWHAQCGTPTPRSATTSVAINGLDPASLPGMIIIPAIATENIRTFSTAMRRNYGRSIGIRPN